MDPSEGERGDLVDADALTAVRRRQAGRRGRISGELWRSAVIGWSCSARSGWPTPLLPPH